MRDIVLSVKALNWRQNDSNSGEADSEFYDVREKVLDRDNKTCQFCGFKSESWQEVHHLNDDHSDNRKENLITICIYCHMCQHIGLAGKNGEGSLIWLPEISQANLNHLVRTIQVAMKWSDESLGDKATRPDAIKMAREISDASKNVFSKLKSREDDALKIFGLKNPLDLANIMLSMPDELYSKRKDFTLGLRLLPTGRRKIEGNDKFPEIVKTWMDIGGPYASFRPATWLGILKSIIQ